MKMKKMITKSVIGLSLLGAGAVLTTAVVPSGNVVYAAVVMLDPSLYDISELQKQINLYDEAIANVSDKYTFDSVQAMKDNVLGGNVTIELTRSILAGTATYDDFHMTAQTLIDSRVECLVLGTQLLVLKDTESLEEPTPNPTPEVPAQPAPTPTVPAPAQATPVEKVARDTKAPANVAPATTATPITTKATDQPLVSKTGTEGKTSFPIFSALAGTIGLVGIALRKKFFA